MTTATQNILRSFEKLPEPEKRKVAFEIIRRTIDFSFPPLTDEDLVSGAEEIFLELDRRESENGKPKPRRGVAS